MTNRLSKEELEQDPLVEKYFKTVNFVLSNKITVVASTIAIITVIGVLIGYNIYSDRQESRAQNLLVDAEINYLQGDYAKALNGDEYTLSYGFSQISSQFSGTNAGNLATYYASVSEFKLDNVESALNYIKKYKAPKGILGVGPLSFHAALLEANGSFESAAQMYEKAAGWDDNNSTTPYNLLQAANAYEDAGNSSKAMSLANSIILIYPESIEFTEAQKLKGMLAISM